MKLVIIEDEPLNARYLNDLIVKNYTQAEVVKIVDSVQSALTYFQSNSTVDLIFADIHLGDGLSFEIFSTITLETPIIFTTAYDHYAIQAFKLNSVDYLLKPIDVQELKNAIEKFSSYQNKQNQLSKNLLEQLNTLNNQRYKERFLVRKADQFIPIKTEEIQFFKSEQNVVFLASTSGKEYDIDYTLDQLETVLDPSNFFRINRKIILSIQSATSISAHFNSRLKVNLERFQDEQGVVSRERVSYFKKWLEGN